MNHLKEEKIRRAIWHINRHVEGLWNAQDEEDRKYEMFHLQPSVECLERVMSSKKIYLYLLKGTPKVGQKNLIVGVFLL